MSTVRGSQPECGQTDTLCVYDSVGIGSPLSPAADSITDRASVSRSVPIALEIESVWNPFRGWRNPPAARAARRGQDRHEHVADSETARAPLDAKVPAIRKWRAHPVTRGQFTDDRLRGLSFGGAVQSQDKPGIGYRFLKDANRRHAAVLAILYSDPAELQVAVSAGDRRLSATDDLHPPGTS